MRPIFVSWIFVSCMCVCVFVSVCMSVCMYVGAVMCLWVCVCLHASMPAFTHVSTNAYYMRTIQVRPYIHVAYDDYVLGPCRAANAGGPGSQGCALAAANSSLRRLHALQQSRVTHARRKCLACSRTFWGKPSFAGQPSERASRGLTISSRSPCSIAEAMKDAIAAAPQA